MKNSLFLNFLFLIAGSFLTLFASAQGNLVLIGGGSESDDDGAWNLEPYTWAVEQSENKKVAILSFYNESDWIRNYFTEQCGALMAKDFKINSSTVADSPSTYDSLMNYDVIFIKGGDQWNYYSTWKNTLTHQAIVDIYNDGGVICGTSAGLAVLSEVVFTAQRGTVYPDECLENPNNQYMTLADDFLSLFDGYIFDSHFTERGRGARLTGFLANRYLYHDQIIKGIGVDETTAMTISSEGLGTVYGTGTVNIYAPLSEAPFRLSDGMLITDSIRVDQLLHGCTYDFNSGNTSGLNEMFSPLVAEENGNFTLLMSGGDDLSDNQSMLEAFVNDGGGADDRVLIVTGSSQNTANVFRSRIINLGASVVDIYSGIGSMQNDTGFEEAIINAEKILLVDNEFYIFEHFLESGGNGAVLYDKVRHDGMVVGFVGDNSRFAGAVVVKNYMMNDAATNGALQFRPGLGLLKTSVIMPNTYYDSDMYMNSAASVPYVMLQNSLRFGFWITHRNYLRYAPDNGKTCVTSYGTLPAMMLELNDNTAGGFAEKTWSSNYSTPAMYAGFLNLNMQIFDEHDQICTGENISLYGYNEQNLIGIEISPNPATHFINIECRDVVSAKLFSDSGKLIRSTGPCLNPGIDIRNIPNGVYVLNISNGKRIHSEKIVIQR